MRMVVVLPAPLRPMNAKTLPRGTPEGDAVDRALSPEVARQPARLDHRVTRVGAGWCGHKELLTIMFSSNRFGFPIQLGQLRVHDLADFLGAEVEEDRLMDEVVDGEPQPPQTFGLAVDLPLLGHEEAHALLGLQHPVAHQLRVGLDHGVGVDDQPLGQAPHTGHGLTGSQGPRGHAQAHLVDDLTVDRRAGSGRDVDVEGGHRSPSVLVVVVQTMILSDSCQAFGRNFLRSRS